MPEITVLKPKPGNIDHVVPHDVVVIGFADWEIIQRAVAIAKAGSDINNGHRKQLRAMKVATLDYDYDQF